MIRCICLFSDDRFSIRVHLVWNRFQMLQIIRFTVFRVLSLYGRFLLSGSGISRCISTCFTPLVFASIIVRSRFLFVCIILTNSHFYYCHLKLIHIKLFNFIFKDNFIYFYLITDNIYSLLGDRFKIRPWRIFLIKKNQVFYSQIVKASIQ